MTLALCIGSQSTGSIDAHVITLLSLSMHTADASGNISSGNSLAAGALAAKPKLGVLAPPKLNPAPAAGVGAAAEGAANRHK